jgi:glycine hydroxymethyltransferase
LVLADIAHIAGLVAAGLHDSPFKTHAQGADFVTTTTHKTLRGPRAAMVFAKLEYMKSLNQTVFPGTSGGPHLNQIAATGQALLEVLDEDSYPDNRSFQEYSKAVVTNCQALETGLKDGGLEIVSPTETHLTLIKLPVEIDSLEVQNQLESLGIITNRNAIPEDTKSPWRPGGLRLGTAALTSRGLIAEQACMLGKNIADIVLNSTDKQVPIDHNPIIQSLQWYYDKS